MSTRVRQQTAEPSTARTSNQLPPYVKPTFPLNPAGQRALAQLGSAHGLKKLDETLKDAQASLSESAGDINDRLTVKDRATKKRKARDEQTGSDDAEAIEQSLDELRDKVERMTQRLDEGMRKVIDGQHSVQSVRASLTTTAQDARANASTQASTQDIQSQMQRRRDARLDGDNEDDDEEFQDFTPTDPAGGTQAYPSPFETFKTKMDDAKTRYQNHSLTERYADNANYRDFRRVVHDATHPEDDVDMPHHSEWFDEGVPPAPGMTTRRGAGDEEEDDDDDDIAVSRVTISTKCPLSLMEFKDPLTSKKCPHTFEAEYIIGMINQSPHRENGRSGERYSQCPMPGCTQTLYKADLHHDAVMIRKIKRIQRARELEEEDAEDEADDDNRRGTQKATEIDVDDDAADVDDIVEDRVVPQTQFKTEVRSTAPPASIAPQSTATVVNLGDSSDEEDEADEDETMED